MATNALVDTYCISIGLLLMVLHITQDAILKRWKCQNRIMCIQTLWKYYGISHTVCRSACDLKKKI